MSGFIHRREPQTLLFLAAHRGTYVRLVQMPRGVGIGVVSALVERGLLATGPATEFPREPGYMITAAGLQALEQHQARASRLELLRRNRKAGPTFNSNG